LQEALSGPDAHLWLAANDREMKSQFKNGVSTIVPRPKDYNVVSAKFVFTIKSKIQKPRHHATNLDGLLVALPR
jgi:hypothetical protein